VSPNLNEKHAWRHVCTLHAPAASSEVYPAHKGLAFSFLALSPFDIHKVCILHQYPDQWFPFHQVQFWTPAYRPGL